MRNRNNTLKQIVPEIAKIVAKLGSGPAAELRRGPTSGAGVAAYWRIAAEYDFEISDRIMPKLVQIVAILTPKGNIGERPFFSAHNPKVPMGQALCNAGISELRLSRFLDTPKPMRPDSAVRISRRLSGSEQAQFDLITLAHFLYSNRDGTAERIARDYYRTEYKKTLNLEDHKDE